VSSLDLPPLPQPQVPDPPKSSAESLTRGYVPYPADPAEEAIAQRPLQDPTPGYYTPDPAQAVVAARSFSRRQLRAARRLAGRYVSAEALQQALGSTRSSPEAPYGRDRQTGEPLSDKNRILAAFLQLFLGGIGAGRFYIGDIKTGFMSLVVLLVAILTTATLPLWIFPFWILFVAIGLWSVADFLMIISGHIKDSNGRKLR